MNLQQLRYAVEVAKTGSITAAAKNLYMGQPNLSKSIRELDKMGYDAIVMAQVSMRALLPDLKDVKTPLLCSFFSGYGAIADKLNEIAAQKQ